MMRPIDTVEAPHEFVALLIALSLIAYTAVVGGVAEERVEEVWSWVIAFLQGLQEVRLVCRVLLLAL